MNFELVLQSFYDAFFMDLNIIITIIPSMFVIKSNAMEKFMSHLPLGKAVIAELNDLSAVLFAHLGETSEFSWIILNEDFINIFWSCWSVMKLNIYPLGYSKVSPQKSFLPMLDLSP